MRIAENELHIESYTDLEAEICRYNCKDKEELFNVLLNEYNTLLILDYENQVI